ncbi:MAG: hypothetical protein EOP84_01945 [Verrucomicrobiaceae bacterium]|nr:MAG: hypothetical protein EOP84_01945 [Verrucomicrobiaceae bacterium]
MKNPILRIFLVFCFALSACSKKPIATSIISAEVSYSHPDQLTGGHKITQRSETGSVIRWTPGSGQTLTLKNGNEVTFKQKIDDSDPSIIRLTVESEMDGFPTESKIFEYSDNRPNPPVFVFKNGLHVAAAVSRHTP